MLFAGLLDLIKRDIRAFGSSAARCGHLNLVRWAWAAGCPCERNRQICYMAAEGGNLQLLQWPAPLAAPGTAGRPTAQPGVDI
jgi:hypothetical protein